MTDGVGATKVTSEMAARVGRPVDADGQATRARILITDRTTFADLGHAATTYRLLAESTGLAHSAAYDYFGSKAAPYSAVAGFHRSIHALLRTKTAQQLGS